MRIESIRLKNFKTFRDVQLLDLPDFCVVVGANGSGKSTLFDVFGFLHDCLKGNVRQALDARGRFQEVISRDSREDSKKRLLLNDDQRRRLAVKAKVLGRKLMEQVGTLFTPDTLLRWHRMLVAEKWNHADKRKDAGRPRISQEVTDLVLRFARENPTWVYDRIADALSNLGHSISDQTVGDVLKANGIEPAPERKRSMTWGTFLKAHWDQLAAIDFTTVEVWTKNGLVTFYLLFAMHLATWRVKFVRGSTTGSPSRVSG